MIKKQNVSDYLNVIHKVTGDKEVVEWLQRGSPLMVERMFFFAKRDGQTSFYYKDQEYLLIRNRDSSYDIKKVEDLADSGIPLG